MRKYHAIYTTDNVKVMESLGSAALTYEFQKAYVGFIGPSNPATATLEEILALNVGGQVGWHCDSVDGKRYSFWSERLE